MNDQCSHEGCTLPSGHIGLAKPSGEQIRRPKRLRFGEYTLLDQGDNVFEIDIGGMVVGRVTVLPEDPHTGEDDVTVTDYSTDIDEDGSYGGACFTSTSDAWDYIRRVWKDDLAEVRDHQAGKHRSTQRRPETCPACKYTLSVARQWQQTDSTFRDRDISDDDIVGRYLFHAERMSAS